MQPSTSLASSRRSSATGTRRRAWSTWSAPSALQVPVRSSASGARFACLGAAYTRACTLHDCNLTSGIALARRTVPHSCTPDGWLHLALAQRAARRMQPSTSLASSRRSSAAVTRRRAWSTWSAPSALQVPVRSSASGARLACLGAAYTHACTLHDCNLTRAASHRQDARFRTATPPTDGSTLLWRRGLPEASNLQLPWRQAGEVLRQSQGGGHGQRGQPPLRCRCLCALLLLVHASPALARHTHVHAHCMTAT